MSPAEYEAAALAYLRGEWSHPGFVMIGAEVFVEEHLTPCTAWSDERNLDARWEVLGHRYLLVAHHSDVSMWAQTFDTLDELAKAVAAHVADSDYGVSALVDLETREPIPYRVTCALGAP